MRNLTVGLLNIDRADLTIDILDKLACLSANDWTVQLILVDNGSTDEQVHELSDWFLANKGRFAEALFIAASDNLGANGGRNVVLKLASGYGILILDNDLILSEDCHWLDTLWKRMQDDPHCGIVGPMLVSAEHPDVVQAAGIGLTPRGRVGYLHRGEPVERIAPGLVEVVASPAACWLMRREAQKAIGLFALEYYPMQYWDVDYCVQLGLAGWKILCDHNIRMRHIGNVTTRNLEDHPYARVAVRHGMLFRQKWVDILPRIATLKDEDIYWGPIPRV